MKVCNKENIKTSSLTKKLVTRGESFNVLKLIAENLVLLFLVCNI